MQKHDTGKVKAGQLLKDFAKPLLEVAKVTTFGCEKYVVGSWVSVPNARERYFDALCRHLILYSGGEANDPESGLPHMAHVIWNGLAVLYFDLTK